MTAQADGFTLEGDAGAAGAGDGDAAGPTGADGHAGGGDFVFALHEGAAVFGEFAAENFHDFGPGSDGIGGAEANAGGDQAVGEGFVAGHDDLRAGFFGGFNELEGVEDVAQGVAVAGMEGGEGAFDDAFVLAAEALGDEAFELGNVQIEHFCDQAEGKDVFALVLGGAADCFNGAAGNGNGHVAVILFPCGVGLDVVGIVEDNAAFAQGTDVLLVGMGIKGDEHVGFVAGAQDFAGADADLEDGRAAGNGGGDGHESHDLLLAATGQASQETADGLDAVLGVAGEADDGFGDFRHFWRPAVDRRRYNGFTHFTMVG